MREGPLGAAAVDVRESSKWRPASVPGDDVTTVVQSFLGEDSAVQIGVGLHQPIAGQIAVKRPGVFAISRQVTFGSKRTIGATILPRGTL